LRHLACRVQYKGTRYLGFQRQSRGPTIQGVLEACLESLIGERVTVLGAGRTDAGVHALGQVVSFKTRSTIPIARFPQAMNSRLPEDICVMSAWEVPASFHPVRSALEKEYVYLIWNGLHPSCILGDFTWHVRGTLDVERMRRAAAILTGRHDFRAFRNEGSSARTTVRELRALTVEVEAPDPLCPPGHRLIRITARADGFLYNMMRVIVGTLVEVGRGKLPEDLSEALRTGDRTLTGPTAPARGLFLMRVIYPPELDLDITVDV